MADHEVKYTNDTEYWISFNKAATDLRQEALDEGKYAKALIYYVWCIISVRYSLRVVGFRAELYKLAAVDPTHEKLVLPALERRGERAAADEIGVLPDEVIWVSPVAGTSIERVLRTQLSGILRDLQLLNGLSGHNFNDLTMIP